MLRREISIADILINGRRISRAIIDPHVEKHRDINEGLILMLIQLLHTTDNPADESKWPYRYYVSLLVHERRQYKIVWLLEEGQDYIGVITVHRERRRR